MLKMLIIVPSSLSLSLVLFYKIIRLLYFFFSISSLSLSVPISLKRRKFIHYPGRTVLDSSRLDNWTANPMEPGSPGGK